MANISRQPIAPQHEKITVQIAKEDYMPGFEKSLKQYAKQTQMPGFRKGMVPIGMVRKMHGQNVFNDEVMKTAGRKLEDYLRQENMPLLGQPMLLPTEEALNLSMTSPGDVTLSFEVGLRPDVAITALSGSKKLKRYKIAVNDKMLDDEIDRLTRRFGKVESQDTVNHKESVLYITAEPTDGTGKPTGQPREEATVLLGNLPGQLQEQLMNKKAGDAILIRPVDVATAEELPAFMEGVIKGDMSTADFMHELRINKVGLLIPAELDGALMLQVFPNDAITEEGPFRERLREELQKEYDRLAGERLNNEIFETLVHETPMTLPVDFLKRAMREGGEKRISAAQAEQEYPGYEHSLRWQLITDKLLREHEELRITPADMKQHIKASVMGYFGMTAEDEAEGEAPWLDSYVDKMGKDEKTMNETYSRLLTERIFNFLRTQFDVQEESIEEEAFFKLPHSHHH